MKFQKFLKSQIWQFFLRITSTEKQIEIGILINGENSFFFQNPHHYWFNSLCRLVALGKYTRETLGEIEIKASRQHQPDFCIGLILRGIEQQYKRSELNNNPLSQLSPKWIKYCELLILIIKLQTMEKESILQEIHLRKNYDGQMSPISFPFHQQFFKRKKSTIQI